MEEFIESQHASILTKLKSVCLGGDGRGIPFPFNANRTTGIINTDVSQDERPSNFWLQCQKGMVHGPALQHY